MGFDFLPQDHGKSPEQRSNQGTTSKTSTALFNDDHTHFLVRDSGCNSSNALSTLPDKLNVTHLEAIRPPDISDRLHSWKDLMRDSSSNRVRRNFFTTSLSKTSLTVRLPITDTRYADKSSPDFQYPCISMVWQYGPAHTFPSYLAMMTDCLTVPNSSQ